MNKKNRILREVGKVLVNLGNLSFTSLVLGSIIRGDFNRLIILLVGGCIVALFITIGIVMVIAGGEE